MGHLGVRKLIRSYNFYNDANKKSKHKCDFCIPCILKVTTLDGKCVNYDVLKCKDCLSFIQRFCFNTWEVKTKRKCRRYYF